MVHRRTIAATPLVSLVSACGGWRPLSAYDSTLSPQDYLFERSKTFMLPAEGWHTPCIPPLVYTCPLAYQPLSLTPPTLPVFRVHPARRVGRGAGGYGTCTRMPSKAQQGPWQLARATNGGRSPLPYHGTKLSPFCLYWGHPGKLYRIHTPAVSIHYASNLLILGDLPNNQPLRLYNS